MCTLEVLCKPMGECLAFYSPSHSTFPLTHSCLLFCFAHQVGFPHSLALKTTHCICGQLLYFVGTHFFVVPIVGNGMHPMMWFEMPLHPLWEMHGFIFHMKWPMSFHPFSLIFSSISWHRISKWWHSHSGKCDDYWPHLSKLGFSNYFISRGAHDDGSLGKGRTLPQLLYLVGCPWWW